MSYVLSFKDVGKYFLLGRQRNGKVEHFNLDLSYGEIYGLVGQNGAGKTCVIRLAQNQWKPTYGSIEVFGGGIYPYSWRYKRRLGVVPERSLFYSFLTGRKNMEWYCARKGRVNISNIDRTLRLLGLDDVADMLVIHYSAGMMRKLAIARAFVMKPALLLLDEPFLQLGMSDKELLRCLLQSYRERFHASILIAVSDANELGDLADRVGVMEAGTIVREMNAEEYKKWLEKQNEDVW